MVLGVPFSSFEVPIAGSGGAIGGAGGAGGAGGMFGTRDAFDDELFAIEGGTDPGTDGLAAELELCAELMTFLSSLLAFISDKNGNPPDGSGGAVGTFPSFRFCDCSGTVGAGGAGSGGGGGMLFGKGGADVGTGGGPLGNGGGFDEGSCAILLF